MDVRMPDGTIIRNVPEGTTKAQLMSRYQKAQPKPRGLLDHAKDALSSVNEAIIGAPESVYNAAAAVTDPVSRLIFGDEAVKQAQGQRKRVVDAAQRAVVSRPMPIARDVGRVAGSLAIPLPGKKLQEGGRLARTAYRAMQGAVGGAGVRDSDDESALNEAGIGAGVNMALPPILRMLANTGPGRAVGNVLGRLSRPVVEMISGPAPAKALPNAERPLAPLGRNAEARAARFKKLGIDEPTTGMVTRDPTAYSFEQNQSKIAGGEALQQQMRDVESTLVEKGRQMVRSHGGSKGAEATGVDVQKALDAKRGEMQEVTSKLYDAVREKRGEEIVGALDKLNDLMTSPDITDNATFDQMRESLARRMARLGLPADKARATIDDLSLKDLPPGATPPASSLDRFNLAEAPNAVRTLDMRNVPGSNAAKPTRVRGPMDMSQQLRAWGGIRDQGGELRHLGIDNKPRRLDFGSDKPLGTLVNDRGMDLDEAAERLWEAGYWNPHGPRPTPDDLVQRLKLEAMGERQFRLDDLDEVGRFNEAQAEQYKIQKAADDGAPLAEDVSQPAAPIQAPLSAHDEAAAQSPRGVTVRQAEELRKFIGGLGNTADPAVRMMRSNLIDALDDDVVNSVGDDAFKEARASAKARFGEFKKTFAGRIADEGIAPDKLTKRVLSDTTKLKDIRALKQSLHSGTEEQIARGKEAWQGLKAQALSDLMKASVDADGRLIGSKMSAQFVAKSEKLRELLDPADYKQLRRLALASRDVTAFPKGHSVNTSGTATTLANMFQSTKPAVRQGLLKLLAKHGVTALASAPVGAAPYANIALAVGSHASASRAEQKAAELLMRRVQLARSPEATAKALAALKAAAKSNPAAAKLLEKIGAASSAGITAELAQ